MMDTPWEYEQYNAWGRSMAKQYDIDHLKRELAQVERETDRLEMNHLRAIQKTSSMTSCSQRRAQTRNSLTGNYERRVALKAAIEIYDKFPEHSKKTPSI